MPTLFRQTKPHALPANAEIVQKDDRPHARVRDGKQTKLYPLTADGQRYLRPTPMWCAMVRGADGRRKPVRLSTDKDAAAVLLAKLLKDIEQEKAGIRTPTTAQAGQLLSTLLTEYRDHHADKGNTPEQTAQAVRRCELAFVGCGFLTLADLDATAAERWLATRRATTKADGGFGSRTSNHYVTAMKAFGNWLVKARRAVENPFRFLGKVNTEVDVRHVRRPLTDGEFDRLLTAADRGEPFRGLAGADRAMLYTVAAYTGLRASELASLTPSSFQFAANPPTLTVAAGYSKRKRRDTVPLHPGLIARLRPWLETRPVAGPLWPGKWAVHNEAVDIIRRDLVAARAAWIDDADTAEERAQREQSDFLAYEDASGGKADFHALRHRFVTELVKAGVQPKDAKELARHSTITLTTDRYAHVTLTDTAAALAKLPSPVIRSRAGVAPGKAEMGEGRGTESTIDESDGPAVLVGDSRKCLPDRELRVDEGKRAELRTVHPAGVEPRRDSLGFPGCSFGLLRPGAGSGAVPDRGRVENLRRQPDPGTPGLPASSPHFVRSQLMTV